MSADKFWALLAVATICATLPGALIGLGLSYFLGSDLVPTALAGGAIGAGIRLMLCLR